MRTTTAQPHPQTSAQQTSAQQTSAQQTSAQQTSAQQTSAQQTAQRSALRTPSLPQLTLTHDERGTTTVEYVILLVMVAVIAIVAWSALGASILEKVEYATEAIRNLGR